MLEFLCVRGPKFRLLRDSLRLALTGVGDGITKPKA